MTDNNSMLSIQEINNSVNSYFETCEESSNEVLNLTDTDIQILLCEQLAKVLNILENPSVK